MSLLSTARDGTFVAAYSYLANSPLVSHIAFKSNTTVRLTTTKTYDNLNRLTSIASVGAGSTPSVSSYTYLQGRSDRLSIVRPLHDPFMLLRVDADAIAFAGAQDEFFRQVPQASAVPDYSSLTRLRPGERSPFNRILGSIPAEESDEEFAAAVEALS